MKSAALVLAVVAGLVVVDTQANPEGAPPGHTGGPGEADCAACHDLGAEPTARSGLTIDGLPDTLEPGREYELRLTLLDPEARVAGFQLTVDAGGSDPGEWLPGEDQALSEKDGRVYLNHAHPHTTEHDPETGEQRAQWVLRWRAPEQPGDLSIRGAAVAGDDDSSPFGDTVYTLSTQRRLP